VQIIQICTHFGRHRNAKAAAQIGGYFAGLALNVNHVV
jgi:hypothetical protein